MGKRRSKWTRDTDTLRECSDCHELKIYGEFRVFKTRHGQLSRQCRLCEIRSNLAYRRICPTRSGLRKPPKYIDTETVRECGLCGGAKPLSEYRFLKRDGRLTRRCGDCLRKIEKRYRLFPDYIEKKRIYEAIREKTPKVQEYRRMQDRERKQERLSAIIKYGGRCTCCGLADLPFLCIDHVFNGGGKERHSQSRDKYWRNLLTNPISGRYQVLCHNCNMAKQFNGGTCPHQSRPRPFIDNPVYEIPDPTYVFQPNATLN